MGFLRGIFKFFFYIGLIFVGLAVLAVIALNTSPVTTRLTAFLEKLGEENGVQLKLENLSVGASGVGVQKAEAFFKQAFLSFSASDLNANVDWLELLNRRLGIKFGAKLYEGTLSTSANSGFGFDDPGGSIVIKDVQLNAHPQIAGLGFTRGFLDLDFAGKKSPSPDGILNIKIRDLERPVALTLPIKVSSTSSAPLTIPKFGVTEGMLSARLQQERVIFDTLSVNSTLGQIRGQGQSAMVNNRLRAEGIKLKVKLSPDGVQHIGPQLPEISKGALIPENECFECEIRGSNTTWRALSNTECSF